jgi:hypothetical protein
MHESHGKSQQLSGGSAEARNTGINDALVESVKSMQVECHATNVTGALMGKARKDRVSSFLGTETGLYCTQQHSTNPFYKKTHGETRISHTGTQRSTRAPLHQPPLPSIAPPTDSKKRRSLMRPTSTSHH